MMRGSVMGTGGPLLPGRHSRRQPAATVPVPIVGSSDDLSTGPESVGHILGRLAYEYAETKKPAPKGGLLRRLIRWLW